MDLFYSLSIIFTIIAVGVYCGKKEIFNTTHMEGFELFLFKVGVPCFLFSAVTKNNLNELINLPYMYSYLLTFIIISGISAAYFYRTNQIQNVMIKSLASGYVNAAIYVLPIVTFLLGNPNSAILGNLIQVIIIQTIFMTILSFMRHREQSLWFRLTIVLKNPIVTFPIVAIILQYSHLNLPFLNKIMDNLGNGAAGMSLFTFGLMLSSVKLKSTELSKEILATLIFKNLLHPIISVVVGLYVFNLDRYWLYSLVIAASAPTAFMVYFVAKQFSIESHTMRLIVSLSSMLSLITLTIIILFLKLS